VLAEAGATVVVPARTPDKAGRALASIARVEQARLDRFDPCPSPRSRSTFSTAGGPCTFSSSAGIMAPLLMRDARGYESQFSANHLGHFQLTAQLLPALREARGARVVSVSSAGHRFAGVDFDDPNFERRAYDRWMAYGQSKTANLLFALALDARGEAHGIRALSVHPGRILATDLARHLSIDDLRAAGALDEHGNVRSDANLKTPEQGAATSVWCATSAQLQGLGGVYCEDVDIARAIAADSPDQDGVRPWAIDAAFAERLWALSEKLTGVSFRP
jgi:NAD(P)-dependent dehydrogenase (short-subunit alcohol dehydrogenase family)